MSRIFISYARKYEAFARKLATSLSDVGADIWLDVADIPAGMNWSNAIQEGLDAADLMIVVLTPESASSKNVENEWQYYLDEHKPIIPILLVPTKVHFQVRRLQYVDFHSQDYDTAFRQLHSELRQRGLQLAALTVPDSREPTPAQSPLPTSEGKPAARRPSGIAMGAAIGLVAVSVLLIVVSRNPSAPLSLPTTQAVVQPTITVSAKTPTTNSDSTGIQTTSPTLCDWEATLTPGSSLRPGIDAGITANDQWTPVSHSFDNVEMLLVPIGSFEMGSYVMSGDIMPVERQCIDQPFWIDRTEVTNKQVADLNWRFTSPSNWPGDNRPRESVNWFEARSFCEGRGARLPTEMEWEYAARGPDNLSYSWGNAFIADNAVFKENSGDHTAEVGSRPGGASWVGALDMSGNVEEWVSSAYLPYPYRAEDGREGSVNSQSIGRVARGGSWGGTPGALLAANRGGNGRFPSHWSVYLGFRCARDFSESDLSS